MAAFGLCFVVLRALRDIDDEIRLILLLPSAAFCLGAMCAVSYLAERNRRAVLKRDLADIRARDFRVCLHCRYDLSRTPDATACPECGRPFNHALARASWLWTYRDALPRRERDAKRRLDPH